MDGMRALGLDPRIDPAGNIPGQRAGSEASLKPILFGSHIDSVRGGGNFDGDYRSMAALEVIASPSPGSGGSSIPRRTQPSLRLFEALERE